MNQPKYKSRCYKRVGKVMLSLVFATFLTFTVQAQLVNLSVTNQPITKVCKEIEKQTGFYFIYANDLKDKSYPVSVNIKNQPVREALEKIFEGTPYAYEVNDKLVSVNTAKKTRIADPVPADTISITGIIYDGTGKGALENASVMTSITKRGAMTDVHGRFKLKGVKRGELIIVSYLGYEQNKIIIEVKNDYFITLKPSENILDNVVIKAYGTTTKRFSTGSIVSISGKEIAEQPVMNPIMALQGRVPGMVITQTDGNPASPVKIEIRGRNSLNRNMTSEPLYIIDGVPFSVMDAGPQTYRTDNTTVSSGLDQTGITSGYTKGISPLYGMNMDDISSITVLKDADATAIYGSRGANGVILINTKRGQSGRTNINVNLTQGQTYITHYLDMLSTSEYLALRREAFANDGITPSKTFGQKGFAPDLMLWDSTRDVNWQKLLWNHPASFTNVSASVSGGSLASTYRISGNYNKANDISGNGSNNQAASVGVSLGTQALNDKLKINFNGTYGFTTVDKLGSYTPQLIFLPPNAPDFEKADGSLNFDDYHAYGNDLPPFAGLYSGMTSKSYNIRGGLDVNYNITSGLDFSTTFGLTQNLNNSSSFNPIKGINPYSPGSHTGKTNNGHTNNTNISVEPRLNYNVTIKNSVINAFAGATYQANKTVANSINADGYLSDDLMGSISYATKILGHDYSTEYKYAGVFAGITYRLKDRYIASLNGRRDGSSRFGPGKEFGNFGSVGLAWIISDEAFAKKILPSFISSLKVQSSYGITGSDGVGEYQYLPSWGNTGTTPQMYNGIPSLYPLLLANNDYHWQQNKKMQFSVDLGLLEDRILLNAQRYIDRCNNQLVSYPVGSYTGFMSYTANSPANVQNSGWDISMSSRIIQSSKVNWTLSGFVSINRNKLLSYPLFEYSPYYTTYKIGYPLSIAYKYKFTGIDPKTGQPTYQDANNDGKIDYDLSVPAGTGKDDRTEIVNTTPPITGGLTSSLNYKKFSLTLVFSYKRNNQLNVLTSKLGELRNYSHEQVKGHWQYEGQIATSPKASTLPIDRDLFSDADIRYEMINVIRLSNASFKYTMPAKWAQAVKMANLNLSLNSNNLLLITNYKGLDPDHDLNYGGNPPTRTITFTLGATF
ncbi:SusC/RagA family TonB-linked outer membrane protein [Chitinophaga silvatica]|uniref:SusC/RagA family TonB-linked outer membrane protein n=1 Tax=Chitinophaga silvatica TaxID=2282649 RepID=A0A3E1Y279_9BACT|nr:SusC/RagA family TonB-linked outer membrane protein [Chitinophaga silvatica]RFS18782.1 SusC/RagA family TonB-linked outer membrane protein [Chitinophaga silvatica]